MEMEKGMRTVLNRGKEEEETKRGGWREVQCETESGGEKKRWSNPGKRGEKVEPMLTPLCLSQVENDEGGVKGMRSGNRETRALKEHNVVISSFH